MARKSALLASGVKPALAGIVDVLITVTVLVEVETVVVLSVVTVDWRESVGHAGLSGGELT